MFIASAPEVNPIKLYSSLANIFSVFLLLSFVTLLSMCFIYVTNTQA